MKILPPAKSLQPARNRAVGLWRKFIKEVVFALKQLTIKVLTALCATAAAAVHAYFVWPEMHAKTHALPQKVIDQMLMPMICEECIIFIATAYYVGQKLAAWIGDYESAALLKAQSSGHLRILHAMCGGYIIATRCFLRAYYSVPLWQNIVMIAFGAFLLITAIFKSRTRSRTEIEIRQVK